jgi:hypothetical protein
MDVYMLEIYLPKYVLVQAAEQIKSELDTYENSQALMKKALLLYRMGAVYKVKVEDGLATALVLDDRKHIPTLDLEIIQSSHCTCGTGWLCPHLLALFFYLYSSVDQVSKLINEWKMKRSGKVLPLKKAGELLNHQHSINGWMVFFEQRYKTFQQINKRDPYEYIHQLCYQFLPSLRREAPMQLELKRLYSLHAGLFTFRKLVEYGEQLQHLSRYHTFLQSNASHLASAIEDELSLSFSAALEPLLEESSEHVRSILLSGHILQHERVNIYRSIWSTILNNQKWIATERDILLEHLQLERERHDKKNFLVECQLALAHLAFLQQEDKEAISLLNRIQPYPLSYTIGWMEHIARRQQWERLKQWLDDSLPHVESYIDAMNHYESHYMTYRVIQLFGSYADATNEYGEYEAVLNALFPYSAAEYSRFLFERGEYRKWVDLHLFMEVDVGELDRTLLKVIEMHDRSLLLPLYHRSVIKMLQLKNRQSYKTAVKYLKKLRTYYRHLKQEDEWQTFMTRLVEEYKRYRAFQEELKKGKLING